MIHTPNAVRAARPKTYTGRSGSPAVARGGVEWRDLRPFLDLGQVGFNAVHKVEKSVDEVYLDDVTLTFEFSDPDDTVDLHALHRAARRVPYFGRSQNGCDMVVSPDRPAEAAVVWSPTAPQPARGRSGRRDGVVLRGWAPNSIEWMDINHELAVSGSPRPKLPADGYSTRLSYRPRQEVVVEPHMQQWVSIMSLTEPLAGEATPGFLRQLTLEAGVELFPCVFVGHAFADGSLRGIGLVGADRAAIVEAAALAMEQFGLRSDTDAIGLETLAPSSWSSPSAAWRSATPLRAFPDERVLRYTIEREAVERFGVAPSHLNVFRQPVHRWQRQWPQPQDGLRAWWVELEFEHDVAGPMQLGATRELGFGMFVPRRGRAS